MNTQLCPFYTAALNNIGVDFLAKKNYGLAIRYLSLAFEQSRSALHGYISGLESFGISSNECPSMACALDFWMMVDGGSPEDTRPQNVRGASVYLTPINIPEKATRPSPINVGASVAFNLALAYHMAAFSESSIQEYTGKNQKENVLREALRLYQYAFRLQRTHAASTDSPFFFMACINNIGIIFACVGDNTKSNECFQHLLSLLMYLTTTGKTLNPSKYSIFFDNTSRLCHPSLRIAAAAA